MLCNKSLLSKILLAAFLYAAPDAFAHGETGSVQAQSDARLEFIENKGQWVKDIRYKARIPDGAMFLTDRGFVYHYVSGEDLSRLHHERGADPEAEVVRHHAYRVDFVQAEKAIRYQPAEKQTYYHNYITGSDHATWKGQVGIYASVLQQGVYNGVDVSVYSTSNSLKYDFIIAPHADPGQILLSFEGVEPRLTAEGHLELNTSVNKVIEEAPYAYQEIDGIEIPVTCRYLLKGNRLSFDLPEGYNKSHPLVIDPSVIFATFSGSTGDDHFAYGTAYDNRGNLYAAVQSRSVGWPVTTGAYQSNYRGGYDLGINKFDATGANLIYSTYYGGTGEELPHTIIVNDQEEAVVVGTTNSTNLPTHSNAYDRTLGGPKDIFVAHFNSTGTALIGATYVGGSAGENIYTITGSTNGTFNTAASFMSPCDVVLGDNGEIWVVSSTESNDFPVTAGAPQTTYGGGLADAVLFRLTPDCSVLPYSTFLGGSLKDVGYSITRNNKKQIVLCGATASPNFPASFGAYRTSLSGTVDGFVTIVSPQTGGIMHSTYLGTDSVDQAYKVSVDPLDNVYVLGRTMGNYPVSQGVYAMPGSDLFLDKLSPGLNASQYSTRIGNLQTAFSRAIPTAFMVDNCGNVFLGLDKYNINSAGYPLTGNAFQTSATRIWFGVLEANFSSLLFGTFYGPVTSITGVNDVHFHEGIHRFDPRGIAYHSVCTILNSFPTTFGSFGSSKTNSTGRQDVLSFKFDLSEYVKTDTLHSLMDTLVCNGENFTLEATSAGINYVWNTGATTRTQRVDSPGTYTVQYQTEGELCRISIDSFRVSFSDIPELDLQVDSAGCTNTNDGQARITPVGGGDLVYTWFREDDGTLLQTDSGNTGSILRGLSPGLYRVALKTVTGCDTVLYFTIGGKKVPEAAFDIQDTILCVGSSFDFTNRSTGAFDTWQWSFGTDGAGSGSYHATYAYAAPGLYPVTLIIRNEHCADTTVRYADVRDFSLELKAGANRINNGEEVVLETSGSDVYTLERWQPAEFFPDQHAHSQIIRPDSSLRIMVWGSSVHGCKDSAVLSIEVISRFQMPTAFSPNGDGLNDHFRPWISTGTPGRVRQFYIFDRWGKRVWSAFGTDALKGWDGTYNGTRAELGTYFYTINIELPDGKEFVQKGDVTLVR